MILQFFYRLQKLICEINSWILNGSLGSFDDVLSAEFRDSVLDIVKLHYEFDFKSIYEKAFDELMLGDLKFNYDENYGFLKRLLNGESFSKIRYEFGVFQFNI